MSTSREEQKSKKKKNLIRAAYDCFLEKGIHKSSIDDIVHRANVAKGTFYLYFHNKQDITESLCVELSKLVIFHAYHIVKEKKLTDYTSFILALLDEIIEYFKNHKNTLSLLEKNLSWPFIEKHLVSSSSEEDQELCEVAELLLSNPAHPDYSRETALKYVFSIISLCGSVGYSAIIHNEPCSIDEMKPILYDIVRKTIQ